MEQPTPRLPPNRVVAILAAGLSGAARRLGDDEARGAAAIGRVREVFAGVAPRHQGTVDEIQGPRFLAIFESPVESVRAAVAIQTELAGPAAAAVGAVRIRLGIHVGAVARKGVALQGESIDTASRLLAATRPGGIAVSDEVYRAVRGQIALPFRDLGLKALHGAADRIHVRELFVGHVDGAGAPIEQRSLRPILLTVISIAVVAGLALLGYRLARETAATRPIAMANPDATAAPVPRRADSPLSVGVTGLTSHGTIPQWMQDSTRDGLNTLLSKVTGLRVFSREKIDFVRQRRGLSEIEVAETLGIEKMISGSLSGDANAVVIEVRVVDTSTGILEASESVRGTPEELIELQNKLAMDLFSALGVQLSSAESQQLFARRTNDTLDGYRLLADTFGEADPGPVRPSKPPKTSWLGFARAAWGQEPPTPALVVVDDEAAIRALLESYRTALEREDVDAVAATHVELTPDQRTGFARYFESADDLRVTIGDVDILVDDGEALATFTRRDVFHDKKSGNELELEVRLSSEVVKQQDRWLLRGVKRSS